MAKNDIRLHSIGRLTGSVSASANKFPNTLSPERTIIIRIYDTSYHDPNKDIASLAGAAIEEVRKAFNSTSTIEKTKGLVEKGFGVAAEAQSTDIIAGATSIFKEGSKLVGGGIDSIRQTYSNFASDFKDVGNVGLAGKDGAPIWMDSLYLPLPNEIAESLSHSYSDTDGFLQTAPIISSPTNLASGGASKVSDIASKATGRQALIRNANKLVQFDSSAFRNIGLSWTLIANNEQESLAIQNIITKLKAYSSPQAVSGKLLLRAPFFCKLEFPNKVIDNALQFKECVITEIEVNYSTSGHMETFSNNLPKTMSLSIKFQDREPKTLQAWAEGQAGYEAKDVK